MNGLVGHGALLLSLAFLVMGIVVVPIALRRGRGDLVAIAYGSVYANFLLVSAAAAAMVIALVTHDFSVSYVAQVGSRATPLFYTIISLWGALEGSILFWAWVLALYSTLVVSLNRRRAGTLVPYAAMVLLAVSLFFAILLVGPADPFQVVFPVPPDGPGPNPLLQNHILMGVHPPLLYLGYVGMSVPFAFAIGALLSGEAESNDWIRLTRNWTVLTWGFLSAAIIAGMWWSYEVLGWGGYWAWDPVENASFLPWLTATAFLHSAMVQERRSMLRLWNINLVVGTFVLTILGTFLTRSGIISSVHAFTTGTIGWYFLAFIAVVLLATLALVAGTSDRLRTTGSLDSAASRETVFLLNNLFLTAFMLTVLVGTLYPLVAEAVRGVKVSVGAPFFNRMTLPMIAALLFLMGVGPALPWKSASRAELRAKLLPPAAGAVLLAAVAIAMGIHNFYGLLAFAFVGYSATANLREFWIGARARRTVHGEGWSTALVRLVAGNRRRHGGYIAHLGVFLVARGVTASSSLRTENEATLKPGETLTVAGRTVRLRDVWGREEPQRSVVGATMEVLRGGRVVGETTPQQSDEHSLAAMMVGREVLLTVEKEDAQPKQAVLQVEGLRVKDKRDHEAVAGVSFEVHAGETLGIAGVQGNGQTELVEALTGLTHSYGGKVILDGQDVTNATPRRMVDAGIAHVPEDRHQFGMIESYAIA
ncbi:MAG TPA: cytochrome c-type biogenesis CcmF C-terminal domain-containing protein, partial [Gemmatimonadaceae bacterium]|nr:cytochrome c-type biogenesis CcmF C-terminal domain-containing protein [Gemmatimonadaceae bacterium]